MFGHYRVDRPHIVRVHSVDEIDGRLYIDMRLVEGYNVGDLLRPDGDGHVYLADFGVARPVDTDHGLSASGPHRRDARLPRSRDLTVRAHIVRSGRLSGLRRAPRPPPSAPRVRRSTGRAGSR